MKELAFSSTLLALSLPSLLLPSGILSLIILFAWPRMDFSFLYLASSATGAQGGVFYQIVGTCILLLTAALVVVPFATAIALTEATAHKRFRYIIRMALYALNTTPSIVFGVVGFIFFVKLLGWEKSWLSGGIILATMILPTVTLSLAERIQTIPKDYLTAAKALGFTQERLIWSVILPYGWGGLLTGLVLGLARAAGETAPIMLTAAVFSGATIPNGIRDNPVLALPYHIFNLSQDIFGEDALVTAWATAAVLVGLVFLISATALPFRARSHEEAK